MSRLREMIQELCPDGVEYQKLEEIAHYVRERIKVSEIDVCNYVGVEHLRQNTEGREMSVTLPDADFVIAFRSEDILIGNIRPYLKKAWLADCNGGTNGDVLTIRIDDKMSISPQYLFYILSSERFFSYDMKYAKGAKMPRGDKKAVMNYEIPVPPLPIQNEIVKMLDNFTELTAELTAELALRKKQYNFYRDSLLNFSQNASSVEWKTLREVSVHICSGGTPTASNSAYYSGDIPWLRTQEVDWTDIYDTDVKISEEGLRFSSARWIPENCVIVAMYGATAAKAAINRIPLTTNQACCNLEINENVAAHKYVYHWVCSQYENLKAKGQGSQSNINKKIIEEYPIPIPPLEVQQKIVSILDRFDTLCNDLTQGLPAEIAARKKQYEYYRDKLLTFRRKEA